MAFHRKPGGGNVLAAHKLCSCLAVTFYFFFLVVCFALQSSAFRLFHDNNTSSLTTSSSSIIVNASESSGRKMPENFMGVFLEEINHAVSGGLWTELVANRGFEAGGQNTPSKIEPWSVVGSESSIHVETDLTSLFQRNKVALRLDVLCDNNCCPNDGVGIYNPSYYGMNIERAPKKYKLIFYVRSIENISLKIAIKGSNGAELASTSLSSGDVSNWTRMETILKANGADSKASLHLTTKIKGTIWLDQVSLMPLETYKGLGFRGDLVNMMRELKPKFLRFPGGCYVEGNYLRNAFKWKDTVGAWEERPGHFNDVWNYWSDDGFGYYEYYLLAEELHAKPIWVFNNGISHFEEVEAAHIQPHLQDALDGIEFARGSTTSTWGSLRAQMGHAQPFDLEFVTIGNEDCFKKNYKANYLVFYDAIRKAYPDIKIISNCEGKQDQPADKVPADFHEYHTYPQKAEQMFVEGHQMFDTEPRTLPKVFVSEYALVNKEVVGFGNLLEALAEAGFIMGLEKNSDHVSMASYAPLFTHADNRMWNPDAIVFDTSRVYGTPSYWMQYMFRESSNSTLLSINLTTTENLAASAISYRSDIDSKDRLQLRVVNFGGNAVSLKVSLGEWKNPDMSTATKTLLTSANAKDENTFEEPRKVVPIETPLANASPDMTVVLPPFSLSLFQFLK